MFNSSLAAETIAMRPGLVSGRYPERGEQEGGWIHRSVSALQGVMAQMDIDRWSGLCKIAQAIGRREGTLRALNQAELDTLLVDLRRQFRIQGLSSPLCIQAFSLIREVSLRTLKLRHFDSQLMAGWVMLQGQLAEMETGEGKTLSATLAAATTALAGVPVHIITVNEYLVERGS